MKGEDRYRHSVVEAKGRVWGWQWRRNFGDLATFPVPSLAGRMMREQYATLSGSVDRVYPEVFLGDGLEFTVALKRVDEKTREMAFFHYAIPRPAKEKAHALGIALSTYWQRRDSMRRRVADSMGL